MSAEVTTKFEPSGPLRGTLRPPPDKSISHRAALLGAMGEGETRIDGYLDSADTRAALVAVQSLGAEVSESPQPDRPGALAISIRGVGLRRSAPGPRDAEIDAANAGTLMRVLPGWLAGQGVGCWTIDGDESLRRRPVDRVAEPLRLMGGRVECRDGRLPPLRVEGASLRGIRYELPVASAQVKSCVLVAGLLAEGETEVVEPLPTRDHTERLLAAARADIEMEGEGGTGDAAAARRIRVRPTPALEPGEIVVPGDFSSAAFFIVAALLVPGSEARYEGVGLNHTRTGLLRILERMGAAIEIERTGEAGDAAGEPVGNLIARHGPLRGTTVSGADAALAIDELPLVGLLGCFAEGETTVRDAAELRVKESDRVAALAGGLRALGAKIEPLPDGFTVRGTGGLRGGALDSRGDHRLAMLGAIAGLASRDGAEVRGIKSAAVSYPTFEADLASLVAD